MYISTRKGKKNEVDLLYLSEDKNAHYCYVKSLNRLLARTKRSNTAYKFCRYCLRGFTSQRVLEKHLKYCSKHEAQHVEFPLKGEDDILEFKEFSKQMRVPFAIYCDFEAFTQQIDTCLSNPCSSHTTKTAR